MIRKKEVVVNRGLNKSKEEEVDEKGRDEGKEREEEDTKVEVAILKDH